MKAYKGFEPNLVCRDFQYKEGETFEAEKAIMCTTGFHACEWPINIFSYYPPNAAVYHEVEMDNPIRNWYDSKLCSKKITIGKKLDLDAFIAEEKACAKNKGCYRHEHYIPDEEYEFVESVRAITDSFGTSVSGDCGLSISGDTSIAYTGNSGAAISGERSVASAGVEGLAVTKYEGCAISGDSGISISKGHFGTASAGKEGIAITSDYAKVGEDGVVVIRDEGHRSYVKCGMGSVIVVMKCYEPKVFHIDGKQYMPDKLYSVTVDNEGEVVLTEASEKQCMYHSNGFADE